MTFWREKSLEEMTKAEWESLCDGCGKCCLHRLEDEETGEIHNTNVICRHLDSHTSFCRKYAERTRFVRNCVRITPALAASLKWMPVTCAYRLLAAGKDLPDWHPLVTGDKESVHKAGQSVRGRTVDERDAGDLMDHLVSWDDI